MFKHQQNSTIGISCAIIETALNRLFYSQPLPKNIQKTVSSFSFFFLSLIDGENQLLHRNKRVSSKCITLKFMELIIILGQLVKHVSLKLVLLVPY